MNTGRYNTMGRRGRRLLALTAAAAVALAGLVTGPAKADTSVPASQLAVDTDDTGYATMTFDNPDSARVGDARFVTFTIEGNRQAGKTMWIEITKVVDFDNHIEEMVQRFDVVMTKEPQVIQYQVDTSTAGGYVYFIDSDWIDGACGAAGFGYGVLPATVTSPPTTPPTEPTWPGDEDDTIDAPTTKHSLRLSDLPSKFRAGARVKVTGRLTGPHAANQPVSITAVSARGGAAMGKTKTDAKGRFTIRTRTLDVGMRKLKVAAYKVNASAVKKIKVRY